MQKPVVFAGGGTGGHLYPALALAGALRERVPDLPIHFVGTPERIEATRVPEAGYPFHPLRVVGMPRKVGPQLLRFGVLLAGAVREAVGLLRELDPGVVVGTGGYVSAPALFAARLAGVPYAIQEQNANPGLANRVLGRGAREVWTAWPEADRAFPAGRARCLGNPVRPELAQLTREQGRERLHAANLAPATPHLLLVTGGSLGARSLNQAVVGLLGDVLADPGWSVLHAAGPAQVEAVREATAGFPQDRYRLVPYLEDMPAAMAACDLAISRAGATSLAELTCVGRPLVLVPYAHGGGDQPVNAAALVRAGAAVSVPDDAGLPGALKAALLPLLGDGARRVEMAAASRSAGQPEATVRIAERILAYLGR